mgnify:CR=1 FL=1
MLGQVKSGTQARIAAPRQVTDREVKRDDQPPEGLESPENNGLQASPQDDSKDFALNEERSAADHGLAALLREANRMRDTMEEMPRNLVESGAGGLDLPDLHVRAAVAYTQRANEDKRDEILKPGAVFSADF